MAPPISADIAVVNVLAGKKRDVGKTFICPITMATASASPSARASPRIIPVKIPLLAAGRTTWAMVSQRVAPRPYEASRQDLGTAAIASAAIVVMVGKIMIARTIPAASTEKPKGIGNSFRSAGMSTVIPTKPYTTDGIPVKSSIAGWIRRRRRGVAISVM